MFVSLSHRSQSGIDRLARMITAIAGQHAASTGWPA
jgi:hypothetical protein